MQHVAEHAGERDQEGDSVPASPLQKKTISKTDRAMARWRKSVAAPENTAPKDS
jgi:hypothetical protein